MNETYPTINAALNNHVKVLCYAYVIVMLCFLI